MTSPNYTSALIVGAGGGLSAALTRLFRNEGLAVAIAARDTAKLAPLCAETGARAFGCDAQDEAQVQRLFADTDREQGARTWSSTTPALAREGISSNLSRRRSNAHCKSPRLEHFWSRSEPLPGCCQSDTERFCLLALPRA